MIVYLFAGLTILFLTQLFEKRNKVKKTYSTLQDYISRYEESWESIVNEIILTQNSQGLENIVKGINIYLIIKTESEIKVYPLNNENRKKISESHYLEIIKKFKEQDLFYTFNIDTGSIYYNLDPSSQDHILWLYIR